MAENNVTKKKILLAEDDKFISRAYLDGLSRGGFEVISAADGNEAVRLAREEKPDIILLDLIMPDKEGLETIVELRKINREIPIIAISGGGTMGPETYLPLAV